MAKDDSNAAADGTPLLSNYAQHVIAELGLAPHPEGGWYRRTDGIAAHGSLQLRSTQVGTGRLPHASTSCCRRAMPVRGTWSMRTSCGFGTGPVR